MFLAEVLETGKPATVANCYRSLQQSWKWVDEGEVKESPMARMRPPKVPQQPPAVLRDDELGKLLAACSGPRFEDRRGAVCGADRGAEARGDAAVHWLAAPPWRPSPRRLRP
jgi:site-specific recombinase XerC